MEFILKNSWSNSDNQTGGRKGGKKGKNENGLAKSFAKKKKNLITTETQGRSEAG